MSDITVVDKENLRDYRESIFLLGSLVGVIIGSFTLAIIDTNRLAAVIGAVYFVALILSLYLLRDKFSNITQAIEDIEGENQ